MTAWKTYEEVATYLLNQFAAELGLDRVEGTQPLRGKRTGTVWNVDAKGSRSGHDGFVIVECRRHLSSRQSQEHVAALAFRIHDTGAQGGIIVSPLGFQRGAQKVASSENIISIHLHQDSTRHEYLLQFLNKIMAGVHDTLYVRDSVEVTLRDAEGNIVRREVVD